MEETVKKLLSNYLSGRVNRRELINSLSACEKNRPGKKMYIGLHSGDSKMWGLEELENALGLVEIHPLRMDVENSMTIGCGLGDKIKVVYW